MVATGIKIGLLLGCLSGMAASSSVASADIYKYRDRNGHIHLSDRPMHGGYTLLKVFRFDQGRVKSNRGGVAGDSLKAMKKRRKTYEPLIERVARETRLRPELLHAVIRAESAYIPSAVSSAGAKGLMQLMPATAQRYGVSDRADPQQNVRGGATYLRDLLDQFDQDLRLALAAYNAGENAVLKYGKRIPPFPETQNYVRKVIAFLNRQNGAPKLARN